MAPRTHSQDLQLAEQAAIPDELIRRPARGSRSAGVSFSNASNPSRGRDTNAQTRDAQLM